MKYIFALLLSLSTLPVNGQSLQRIGFGSCAHQSKPQPIWDKVLVEKPDLFIFLGDNIYGDSDNVEQLADKYQQLADKPGFQQLRQTTPILSIWDDHDYGQNDSGNEYIAKDASRKLMLDFWQVPANSPRRTQAGGIYTAETYGPPGKRVQIILLDLRWNRTALAEVDNPEQQALRKQEQRGPYLINYDPAAVLIGKEQWQWLEQQLQQPADLRIIGSSIQFLADFTGWESWANFPHERERMIELIQRYQQQPILFISGDVHWAELSEIRTTGSRWPLVELTSSGLTEEWKQISPNIHRVGKAYAEANFGLLTIDWQTPNQGPAINMAIKNTAGQTLIDADYSLNK